jgi:pyruvate dehydrogenase E2 component (dihydrolipoamide acetyltransferase)
MSATLSRIEVPDIGDFESVPVIEILVAVGDQVSAEDPLVTLESDKATMDVPAPLGGVIREINIKLGDQVSQGSLLMSIEGTDGDAGGGEFAEQAAALDRAYVCAVRVAGGTRDGRARVGRAAGRARARVGRAAGRSGSRAVR